MYFQLATAFLVIGFALFLAYLAFLIYNNARLSLPAQNHFRNSFPYNFYMDDSIVMRVLLYCLLGLSILCTCVGESFFFLYYQVTYTLILAILFPLSLLLLGLSNLIPLSYYRLHLVLSAVSFFLFGIASALMTFLPLIHPSLVDVGNLSAPICYIIGAIGFIALGSLCNPKLGEWSRMEKTEINGTTYYVKPKVNFYALYEWIYLFLHELVAFLFFITILIVNVNPAA